MTINGVRARKQSGNLWKSRGWWYVRYRDWQMKDGPNGPQMVRVQKAERLAPATGETRSKESKVLLAMVEERMQQINGPVGSAADTPDRLLTVAQFVDQHFLPMLKEQRKRTTYVNVESIWRVQLKERVGEKKIRDFSTRDGVQTLQLIAHQHPEFHRGYVRQMKSTLSAVFKYARQLGVITHVNPMQDVPVPKTTVESVPGGVYELSDIQRMLKVLPEYARTIVAVAAFTGLRRAELQGLKWSDYTGDELYVRRNVVAGRESATKTKSSNAPIPVIGPLRKVLDQHRESLQTNANHTYCPDGYIFCTKNGGWLNLQRIAEKQIMPELKKLELQWHGWHAFRRSLASVLYALGVADKHIQQIMRHSNLNTTMQIYVRTSSEDSIRAMQQLESALAKSEPASQMVQ